MSSTVPTHPRPSPNLVKPSSKTQSVPRKRTGDDTKISCPQSIEEVQSPLPTKILEETGLDPGLVKNIFREMRYLIIIKHDFYFSAVVVCPVSRRWQEEAYDRRLIFCPSSFWYKWSSCIRSNSVSDKTQLPTQL